MALRQTDGRGELGRGELGRAESQVATGGRQVLGRSLKKMKNGWVFTAR